jgi:hypothetical protein
MIAALFVVESARGVYVGMPNVDPWGESRDARTYPGPWPVVAHPPCARWCRLAGLVEQRWGHARGDDGGCFASALRSVRTYGGVLEHPAHTLAWPAHDLPQPPGGGGWVGGLFCGGFACSVEQGHYGHSGRKPTWLYAHGVSELPPMIWGPSSAEGLSDYMSRGKRARTPIPFRDLLISIARSVAHDG